MAVKATIYKAELQVSDMDRNHYQAYPLTLAQHPSETEERLMIRLLAFALNADPALAFGRGISTDDEPDLWLKDLTGQVELWIEVGQPDERCGGHDAGDQLLRNFARAIHEAIRGSDIVDVRAEREGHAPMRHWRGRILRRGQLERLE